MALLHRTGTEHRSLTARCGPCGLMGVLGQLALWFFIVQLQTLMKALGFHSVWGQTISAAIVVAKSVRMVSPEVRKHPMPKCTALRQH